MASDFQLVLLTCPAYSKCDIGDVLLHFPMPGWEEDTADLL